MFTRHVALATCFDALFAPSDNQEISHRVAERTAVLVGIDEQDVYDVWWHVGSLYSLRSRQLHDGQVLEKQAKDVRKRMQPPLMQKVDSWDGGVFLAPLLVSIEIARRAVAAALRIERARAPESFEPSRLDVAVFRSDERAKLRALRGSTSSVPIRAYVDQVIQTDGLRLWGAEPQQADGN